MQLPNKRKKKKVLGNCTSRFLKWLVPCEKLLKNLFILFSAVEVEVGRSITSDGKFIYTTNAQGRGLAKVGSGLHGTLRLLSRIVWLVLRKKFIAEKISLRWLLTFASCRTGVTCTLKIRTYLLDALLGEMDCCFTDLWRTTRKQML